MKTSEYEILKEMLSLANELSNSNEQSLWELGHYLADNIFSKLSLIVAEKKNKEGFN